MTGSPIPILSILDKDIDELLSKDILLLPRQRGPFLREVIKHSIDHRTSESHLAKLLAILQVLLSAPETELESAELLHGLGQIAELSIRHNPSPVAQQALGVAISLAMRLGNKSAKLADPLSKQLKEVAKKSSNASIRSGIKQLLKQIVPATPRQIKNAKKKISTELSVSLDKSLKTVLDDLPRDWYRDPWDWPDLRWLASNPTLVIDRLNGSDCSWTQAVDVPKKEGDARPALVLSPVDRVAYQALADELSLAVAADLPNWVYGWRLSREGAQKATYAHNSDEWQAFHERRNANSDEFKYVLRVDVKSYFASVDTEQLIQQIGRRYKKTGTLFRLQAYFDSWKLRANGAGLPQRSVASSVLAHMPLRPIDVFLEQFRRKVASFTSLRWMDDIYLFSNHEDTLRSASEELEHLLDRQHLELNQQKTVLLETSESDDSALIDISDDQAISMGDRPEKSEAISEFLEGAEDFERFQFAYLAKFLSSSASTYSNEIGKLFSRVGMLDSFDFAADSIARILKSSGLWKDQVDWYISHIDKHIAPQNWTVAAWGEMFPETLKTSTSSISTVAEAYRKLFATTIQRTLVPLAAHRLVDWDRATSRDILYDYLAKQRHQIEPFDLRAIAMALQQLGDEKKKVHQIVKDADDESLEGFFAE